MARLSVRRFLSARLKLGRKSGRELARNLSLKRGLAPLAAIVLIGGCSGAGVSETSDSASDIAGAQQAFTAYVADINAGDTVKAAQIYDRAEGFHWIERGGVEYASGAEAAASLEGNFPAGSAMSMAVDEIHSAAMTPGSVLVSAHYDFAIERRPGARATGESEFRFDGWMTVGMVKRADGWRIAGGQSGPGREAEKGRIEAVSLD